MVYQRESRVCHLCLDEKMAILKLMTEIPDRTINKKHEMLSQCSHKRKELIDYPELEEEEEVDTQAIEIDQHRISQVINENNENHVDRDSMDDGNDVHRRAEDIFEEERMRDEAVIHTRMMKRRRIDEIVEELLDPG